ncbi:MAG: hypothetical protein EON54_12910 [Alcaligenaceae bacterium]|nr:MAG: hypothetical protein EON54_12910 [Alcaligenaceae bacterium]
MSQPFELLIDEPVAGHFLWKLVKQTEPGAKPHIVDFATGPLPSRQAALAAGQASQAKAQAGIGTSWSGDFADTVPMEL